jgi:diaminopimelate epimerase
MYILTEMIGIEMSINFTKMHGLGNDFVIVDIRKQQQAISKEQIMAMANRKIGIGCDQFIIISSPERCENDCFMHIYNGADAQEVEACGNATRCVGDILLKENNTGRARIETVAGVLICKRGEDGMISVDMGAPKLGWADIPLSKECDTLHLPLDGDPVGVNIGNPHCVYFLDETVENYPVQDIGPEIEHHPLFPERVNVEFINVIDKTTLRMRVWERGAGETQACGTGACAAVIAGVRRGLVERKCKVILDGGELFFDWDEQSDHIIMTGSVHYVFKGQTL